MKILTLLGTRPELIRLSRIIPLLQQHCDHVLVHTGQNYDHGLSGVFLSELGYDPGPKYYLGTTGSVGAQLAAIFAGLETVLEKEKPDRFLVLGDTNSSLGAIIATRMGVPVYHLEAGNRCHDPASPEEVNRRLIDHCSTIHLPYTEGSRRNLLAEGIHPSKIFVTGNPIFEVLNYTLDGYLHPGGNPCIIKKASPPYFLATFHRQENVDDPSRLRSILDALWQLRAHYRWPIIVSTHPRTRARIEALGEYVQGEGIEFREPMGFKEFATLERDAACILSDSGTVCEEAAILGTPCVILRDSTERPETVESGANYVAGVEGESIFRGVKLALGRQCLPGRPAEYLRQNVSQAVVNIVTGHLL